MPHRTILPISGIVSAGDTAAAAAAAGVEMKLIGAGDTARSSSGGGGGGGGRGNEVVPASVPSSNLCLGSSTNTSCSPRPDVKAAGGDRLQPPPLALSEPRGQTAMAEPRIGTATSDTRITVAPTPRAPPVDPSQFDDADDDEDGIAPPAHAAEAAPAPAPARTAAGVSSLATSSTPAPTAAPGPARPSAVAASSAPAAAALSRAFGGMIVPGGVAKSSVEVPSEEDDDDDDYDDDSDDNADNHSSSKGSGTERKQEHQSSKPSHYCPPPYGTSTSTEDMDQEFRVQVVQAIARARKVEKEGNCSGKEKKFSAFTRQLYKRYKKDLSNTKNIGFSTITESADVLQERADAAARSVDVTSPGPHDVLVGRGGRTNFHKGNINYRSLLAEYKMQYINAHKVDKPNFAREVVKIMRYLDPPGRFLTVSKTSEVKANAADKKKKDGDSGGEEGKTARRRPMAEERWHDVGNGRAREKTSQCLRERTAQLRAAEGIAALFKVSQKEKDEREALESKAGDPTNTGSARRPVVPQVAEVVARPAAVALPPAGIAAVAAVPPIKRQRSTPASVTPPSPSKKLRIDNVPAIAAAKMAPPGVVPMMPVIPIWPQALAQQQQQHTAASATTRVQIGPSSGSSSVVVPSSLAMTQQLQQQILMQHHEVARVAMESQWHQQMEQRGASPAEASTTQQEHAQPDVIGYTTSENTGEQADSLSIEEKAKRNPAAAADIQQILALQERVKAAKKRIEAAQKRIALQQAAAAVGAFGNVASTYPHAGSSGQMGAGASSSDAVAGSQSYSYSSTFQVCR
eukprot:CAMPEP_0178508552 /NCGR_PEP_ID=MMETSP0696-20121128/20814_1 /TAXON_ID=265572 /ORGANISM="Extubocellulus spinifer, Strain CCMP396" /LENGTH=800 /DNA_ID=CAMNT_0020138115 /DNA_START=99 /DNA_END=2502 /DNA_ORIENTATION=-